MANRKVKKKSNGKLKNKGVGGKADVHAHEEGKRNKSLLGHNAIFTPEVIDDIHIKSQLGRYRMRGMALMKKIPTFDDLVFLPATIFFILLTSNFSPISATFSFLFNQS